MIYDQRKIFAPLSTLIGNAVVNKDICFGEVVAKSRLSQAGRHGLLPTPDGVQIEQTRVQADIYKFIFQEEEHGGGFGRRELFEYIEPLDKMPPLTMDKATMYAQPPKGFDIYDTIEETGIPLPQHEIEQIASADRFALELRKKTLVRKAVERKILGLQRIGSVVNQIIPEQDIPMFEENKLAVHNYSSMEADSVWTDNGMTLSGTNTISRELALNESNLDLGIPRPFAASLGMEGNGFGEWAQLYDLLKCQGTIGILLKLM